jgi:hypothetical protein
MTPASLAAAQEGVGGCADPLLGQAALFSAGPHDR